MFDKDTTFYKNQTLNCKGVIVDLNIPVVMGILNITPDSFFDGNKYQTEDEICKQVKKMLDEGATFIDVGGYSTRPGAIDISEQEELERVIPTIEIIIKNFKNTLISIDTFRAKVAKEAINKGASLVNDISGGQFDKDMFTTIAALKVPYILMHTQGTPKTMQQNPVYKNVVLEVAQYLNAKIEQLKMLGVIDIIIDVGFGFGKTTEHNFELLQQLNYFNTIFEYPILVGLSRKSMVNKVLDISSKDALNGTTVLNTIALLNGAKILRVHDVKEAIEAIKLVEQYKK